VITPLTMAKHSNDPQTDINVEDLLRLKRSERPSEDFWSDFDRDLHQRMLQTLVKEDPWYARILAGLTGPMAQSIGIAVAAVLVAMLVVRPVFVRPVATDVSVAKSISDDVRAVSAQVAQVELPFSEGTGAVDSRDYGIEVISADVAVLDAGYTREFALETMQVAAYDAMAYSADSAHSGASFATSGVASLVF
jgi:hypothetical protein